MKCVGGSAFHRIGNGDHGANLAVDAQKDRRRALVPEPFGLLLQRVCLYAKLAQKACIAEREPPPVDRAHHAPAGGRIEFADG